MKLADLSQDAFRIKKLICSKKTGDWCRLPYPNHPNGCPNYGRVGCPPTAKPIDQVLDLAKPVYLAFSTFDLSQHVQKMKVKHSSWTERQLRNVLYWQGTSRKQLRMIASQVKQSVGADVILTCPEACGVNVYVTCRLHGLLLQKIKTLSICHHIALIGYHATS